MLRRFSKPCASRTVAWFLVAAMADGCEQSSLSCESPGKSESALFFAASAPFVMPLSAAQRRAFVGVVPEGGPPGFFCTGTLVTSEWVLSARHCDFGSAISVVVGDELTEPIELHSVATVMRHPDLDLVLLHVPGLTVNLDQEPVPMIDLRVDARIVGEVTQLVGFGQQEDFEAGHLEYLAEEITQVSDHDIRVDGRGRSGACVGDSGGPLLLFGRDHRARVAGVLSRGAASCLGKDTYVRVDQIGDWARAAFEHPPAAPATFPCEGLPAEGTCQGGVVFRCERGVVDVLECSDDKTCVFDALSHAARCGFVGEDVCEGIARGGTCDGSVLARCVQGAPQSLDCGACGAVCARDPLTGVAGCDAGSG